jgi:hypothetical protein
MTAAGSRPCWRVRCQTPEKRRRADFVIDTGHGLDAARARVAKS